MEEPWLRGPLPGVDAHVAPLWMSFQMAREDLERALGGVDDLQIWRAFPGIPPLGFQLRHIAGSVERLHTYLRGELLSPQQLAFLRDESLPGAGREELMTAIDEAFRGCEATVRGLDVTTLTEARTVGRKSLPTTVIGLIVHIAEHTQRHVGQAVLTANLLKAAGA